MKKHLILLWLFVSLLSVPVIDAHAGIIIDHTAVDRFDSLTAADIQNIQNSIKWHYAHTSHGSQLTTGLTRLEAAYAYDVTIDYNTLPANSRSLDIFDGNGNGSDTYITPEEYWDSATGVGYTQAVLDENPGINVSQWSWCTQLTSYDAAHTQKYLDTLAVLETANPDVTFVYMTNNAQATGSDGYNAHLRNEMIRAWVNGSDSRVLFDFADLDSWYKDPGTSQWEQATYLYNGVFVPVEHTAFHGSQTGHTTYTSAEQKGQAAWVMMDEIFTLNNSVVTPEPASTILLGIGGLSLFIRRRFLK